MGEIEIRRIREDEAGTVVDMWDRMCQGVRDGGPLTEHGRNNLRRMLAMSAWHRETFCLVAVRDDRIAGFGLGRVDMGDGLLPGALGDLQELWAEPAPDRDGVRRALADAVLARLREGGAEWTVRKLVATDEPEERAFWESLGYEADMWVLSRYADDS